MSDQTNAPAVPVEEVPAPAVEPVEEVEGDEPQTKRNTPVIIGAALAFWVIVGLIIALIASNNRQPAGGNDGTGVQPTQQTTGTISESTVLDLGSIGSYHAVFDTNQNKWTLGIWETSVVRAGTGLSEFKLKATSVSFVMPFDCEINNSAGHISVNGTEWVLGNPARDASGNSLIAKGSSVTIWTDAANESAGFQIWFK